MYVINIKISQEWKKKFNKVQLFTGKEPKFPTPSPPSNSRLLSSTQKINKNNQKLLQGI